MPAPIRQRPGLWLQSLRPPAQAWDRHSQAPLHPWRLGARWPRLPCPTLSSSWSGPPLGLRLLADCEASARPRPCTIQPEFRGEQAPEIRRGRCTHSPASPGLAIHAEQPCALPGPGPEEEEEMRPSPRSPDARWAVGSGHRGPATFLRDDAAAWLSQAGPGEAHLWVPGHDTGIHATHLPSDTHRPCTGPSRPGTGSRGPKGGGPGLLNGGQ